MLTVVGVCSVTGFGTANLNKTHRLEKDSGRLKSLILASSGGGWNQAMSKITTVPHAEFVASVVRRNEQHFDHRDNAPMI